VNYQKKV